tara:strand:- start:772 stop:960 length:189 start_codon:yes stop_codon:yes gene_type:complete
MKTNITLILTHEDVEELLESGSQNFLFKAEPNGIDSDICINLKADTNITDLPLSEAMQLTTD